VGVLGSSYASMRGGARGLEPCDTAGDGGMTSTSGFECSDELDDGSDGRRRREDRPFEEEPFPLGRARPFVAVVGDLLENLERNAGAMAVVARRGFGRVSFGGCSRSDMVGMSWTRGDRRGRTYGGLLRSRGGYASPRLDQHGCAWASSDLREAGHRSRK
jgi:hypothetical protein